MSGFAHGRQGTVFDCQTNFEAYGAEGACVAEEEELPSSLDGEDIDELSLVNSGVSFKCPTDLDSVGFFSRHIKAMQKMKDGSKRLYEVQLSKKQRAQVIHNALIKYHSDDTSIEEKKFLRDSIVLNIWFLLPHVLSYKHYSKNRFDESLQGMVIGILVAIEKFDPSRGTKFTSYLPGYLQSAMTRTNKNCSPVVHSLLEARRKLIDRLPSEAVAAEYQPDVVYTENAEGVSSPCSSDYPADTAYAEFSCDIIPCDDKAEDMVHSNEVTRALESSMTSAANVLTEKERVVITYRYGIFGAPQMTLQDVANVFKANGWRATVEWIFQIEKKALMKLRSHLSTKGITEFHELIQI